MSRRVVVNVVALLLAAAASVPAQSTGSLAGHVRTDDGTPVSGAVVTATRVDGSIVRRDVSGIDGRYRLGLLPPGSYALLARRLGFRPSSHAGVEVESGRSTEVDIVLRDAPTALDPVVVGAAPNAIDRNDTRFGTRIDEAELSALPLGYDFTSIIAFTPGARPDQVWGGATEQANSYVIDGVALNHPGVGGALIPLNPGWLEELEVTGLAAGAELGNFQGGLIRAVTKSGSNTRTGLVRASGETHRLNSTNIGSTETSPSCPAAARSRPSCAGRSCVTDSSTISPASSCNAISACWTIWQTTTPSPAASFRRSADTTSESSSGSSPGRRARATWSTRRRA